jgi:hypothetical protein
VPGIFAGTHVDKHSCPVSMSLNLQNEKVGKEKNKVGVGQEASTCLMERNISEKYQSQTLRPLEHLKMSVAYTVNAKFVCTNSTRFVL